MGLLRVSVTKSHSFFTMALSQKQIISLQQKLSPQQIQMIKLLELPTVQLEQRIKQELEENIVLEVGEAGGKGDLTNLHIENESVVTSATHKHYVR